MSSPSAADTASALTECLQTHAPRVLDFSGDLALPPDPVAWALDLFAANITQADMQSMEPGPGNQDPKLTYFDQRDPASFERFRLRIRNAQPVHGSLVLVDYCSGRGTVRDDADWAWQVFNDRFAAGQLPEVKSLDELRRSCLPGPLRSRGWLPVPHARPQTRSGLAGAAKIPPQAGFQSQRFQGARGLRAHRLRIGARPDPVHPLGRHARGCRPWRPGGGFGQLPHGFSVSRADPVRATQPDGAGGEVTAPPYMKKTDKFNLYFFEPSHFTRETGGPQDDMPGKLHKELAGVLQSKQIDAQTMRRLLSNWWRLASSRPLYQGPYPERA